MSGGNPGSNPGKKLGRAPGASAGVAVGEGTASFARRLVSDLFRARAEGQPPRLVGLSGWSMDHGLPPTLRLSIPDRSYVIGRGETCDLIIPTDEISREHAVLVRRWEGVHIRDLASKNGVQVGGQPIVGEHRLRDGDQVAIGPMMFRLDDPEGRYLKQIEATPETATAPVVEPPAADNVGRSDGAKRASGARGVTLPIVVAAAVLLAVAAVTVLLLFGG
jgi:hypothetical protein